MSCTFQRCEAGDLVEPIYKVYHGAWLGRKATCFITVPGASASHAEVLLQDGAWCLRDASTHGTLFTLPGGAQAMLQQADRALTDGVTITVGSWTLLVRLGEPPSAEEVAAASNEDGSQPPAWTAQQPVAPGQGPAPAVAELAVAEPTAGEGGGGAPAAAAGGGGGGEEEEKQQDSAGGGAGGGGSSSAQSNMPVSPSPTQPV
jgi:predicted component of type VI protein secretion system